MASFINTNMMSLNTQNNLSKSQSALATSVQRLSTGLRVNSAKDDAAGLAIANRMDSSVRGQSVAIRNTNDAISFSQTAEGALSKINDNLQRMRELAVQSSNGTNGTSDRELLNTEFNQLQSEVSRIMSNTNYNGINALSNQPMNIQIGANTTADDRITLQGIDLSSVSGSAAKLTEASIPADKKATMFYNKANGHIYEFVDGHKDWGVAKTEAEAKSVGGQKGYLANITSADEQAFITGRGPSGADSTAIKNFANGHHLWLGGTDAAQEGKWIWSGGPEAGTQFWAGASNGSATGGSYNNWNPGEPNNSGGENYLHTWAGGATWNDIPATAGVNGYVIEYGGLDAVSAPMANTGTTIAVTAGTAPTTLNAGLQLNEATSSQAAFKWEVNADGTFKLQTKAWIADVAASGGNAAVPAHSATVFSDVAGVTGAYPQVSTDALIASNANGVNILNQASASSAINQIDAAMKQVNVAQIQQGATQNRLSAVISSLTASNESTINARSHILDTDFASETALMARSQILQQAGMAMLAQANQSGNGIMTLMR
jgi:flagellin